jgi:aminopeptidase-like protein
LNLKEDTYEVVIDSALENGYLNYGEYYVKGQNCDEVLISSHACHPSLCNDNLSGVVLSTFLAKYISKVSLRYSYRFLFIPGGIGSIVWLYLNEHKVSNIRCGLAISCVGDSGSFTYKKSRQGYAEIDQAVINVLRNSEQAYKIVEFSPYGYDERNFCSPGFNLAVGSLTRSTYSQFPQYHSSADNLDFIRPEYLAESFEKYLSVIYVLENNKKYLNLKPKGEIQLGKRGLYKTIGGLQQRPTDEMAFLWVMNMSDGNHSLLDISDRSGLDFHSIKNAANVLFEHKLLEEVS